MLLLPDDPFSGIGVFKSPSRRWPAALGGHVRLGVVLAAHQKKRVCGTCNRRNACIALGTEGLCLSFLDAGRRPVPGVRLALRTSGVRYLVERQPREPTGGQRRGGGENWPLEPAEGGPLPDDPRLRAMWKKFWGDDFKKLEHSNRKNVVPGAWRVEVSPTVPAAEDHFLHLLEIGSSGTTGKHRVELLKGQNVAGAAFESGPMALFNTGSSPLLEGEVTLPAIACSELLAFGLRENALFEISFGGPNITTPTSIAAPGIAVKTQHLRSNENGVLALTLDNGHSARLRFKQV